MRRILVASLAVVAISLSTASEASAGSVLADLVADYVPGVDPGDTVMPPASGTGSWRYLASETLNPTDAGASLADLEWDSTGELFERPGENHTDGFSEDAILLGVGAWLTMHPADVSDAVVARWIAGPGEAGDRYVYGNVSKGDAGGGDGVRFLIFVDGVPLFDQVVAFDDTVGVSFLLESVPIAEGSTADFVVSKIGDPFFDSTRVVATVSTVPEPSAPMLLLAGALVLAGARLGATGARRQGGVRSHG